MTAFKSTSRWRRAISSTSTTCSPGSTRRRSVPYSGSSQRTCPHAPPAVAARLARWSKTGDVSSAELRGLTDEIQKLNDKASTLEKARYYLADGQAAETVEKVKSMVEDLFLQFPPPRDDKSAEPARNRVLQSNSPAALDAAARSAESDPTLAALMLLKVRRIRLEERAGKLASDDAEDSTRVMVEGSEVWSGAGGRQFT